MAHFELKAVRHLLVSDVLEFADDVRLFRLTRIGAGSDRETRRLHLRAMDGTRLSLLRAAGDQLRVAVRQQEAPGGTEERR